MNNPSVFCFCLFLFSPPLSLLTSQILSRFGSRYRDKTKIPLATSAHHGSLTESIKSHPVLKPSSYLGDHLSSTSSITLTFLPINGWTCLASLLERGRTANSRLCPLRRGSGSHSHRKDVSQTSLSTWRNIKITPQYFLPNNQPRYTLYRESSHPSNSSKPPHGVILTIASTADQKQCRH